MSTEPLPWYYAYSPRYEAFHWMFQDKIRHPKFDLRPQFIEQSVFDKVTYREGLPHYLCGCFVKQENIYELLNSLPEDSYFLYTDVDYHIINLDNLWKALKYSIERKIDMAFQYEHQGKRNAVCNINVGFGLFRVNQKVREFFKQVLGEAKDENVRNDLDVITALLPSFPGKVEVLPEPVICMPYELLNVPDSIVALVPILCNSHKDYRLNLQEKYNSLKSVGVPIQTYLAMAISNGRTPEELGLV